MLPLLSGIAKTAMTAYLTAHLSKFPQLQIITVLKKMKSTDTTVVSFRGDVIKNARNKTRIFQLLLA